MSEPQLVGYKHLCFRDSFLELIPIDYLANAVEEAGDAEDHEGIGHRLEWIGEDHDAGDQYQRRHEVEPPGHSAPFAGQDKRGELLSAGDYQ